MKESNPLFTSVAMVESIEVFPNSEHHEASQDGMRSLNAIVSPFGKHLAQFI